MVRRPPIPAIDRISDRLTISVAKSRPPFGLSRISRLPNILALIFLLIMGSGACTGTGESDYAVTFEVKLQKTLDAAIKEFMVPGAVVGIRHANGQTWSLVSGLSDLFIGSRMTADLHFRIGSVTKSLTAVAVLQLVDQGRITLDSPVNNYSPMAIVRGDQITVRNLLEMRSGWGNYSFNPAFLEKFEQDPQRAFTPEELVAYSNYTVADPGKTFDYNNGNYVLLGLIIEACSGKTYVRYVNDYLLTPLGLSHTFVAQEWDLPIPYARGYLFEKGQLTDATYYMHPSVAWSAGCIVSTAADQLIWLKALVEGRLISAQSHQAQMTFKKLEGLPSKAYGLGIASFDGLVGHNGSYSGVYTSAVYRCGDYDMVVLTNGQTTGGDPATSSADNIYFQLAKAIGCI